MSIVGNAYLEGNWGPVRSEIAAGDLPVEGEIPRALAGTFLRIGPNAQFPPIGRYHLFDGDGMVHAFHLEDGRVSYRNRWVETRGFLLEREAGRALWTGLAEPPNVENPPHGILIKNVANTALVQHAGRLLALWEAGEPHEIRLPDLATVGAHDFGGKLGWSFTAHPKVDPVTGEMIFFGYRLWEPPFVRYGVVAPDGTIAHMTPIPLEVPGMMHDFAITERYSILLDLPITFRLERLGDGKPPLAFEPDRPSRFGILPRHGDASQVRWFEAPACYVFHTVNAYEEGSEVVLEASKLADGSVMDMDRPPRPIEERAGRATRWRFDLERGTVKEEALDDRPMDFPRIDESRTGRRHRYAYAAEFARGVVEPLIGGVVKYDMERGSSEAYAYGPHRFGSEVVFAPRPGARDEDDGWLLGVVHDTSTGTSELVVLDAREPSRGPIARARVPQRVPYGFHGAWIPA